MTRPPTKAQYVEAYGEELDNNAFLEERLAELELALEDRDWLKLSMDGSREFSRSGLARIIQLSRMMTLKNPLINRATEIGGHYVYGQGVSIQYADEDINEVWQTFIDDPKNQVALTSPVAQLAQDRELSETGNLFLAAFTNISTGRVRMRGIPVEEIQDIITDPNDDKQPWYYRRVWTQRVNDQRFTGSQRAKEMQAFYPAMGYYPAPGNKLKEISGHPVVWDTPVHHVKIGGSLVMKFGVPEFYAAFDWAKAVKEQLEDYATTHRALARFVWNLTVKSKKKIESAKTKLGTTLGNTGSGAETNPPSGVASTFIASEGTEMKPIQTKGMAPPPDEGRGLGLMVSAATGIPYTILFGDADVGNLATAKTLDRPTELKMIARQVVWTGVWQTLADYVMMQAVGATGGPLRAQGTVVPDVEDASKELVWRPGVETHFDVEWPAILERDVLARVGAIVKAITLDGKQRSELFDDETVMRMLLVALGEDDIDELIAAHEGNADASEAKFGSALVKIEEMVEANRNG